MPQAQFVPLAVQASVAIGAAREIPDLTDKTIQFVGPFVANIDLEGSLDPLGTAWGVIQTVTAPGVFQIAGTYRAIRARTTSYTSGTPLAYLAGRNDRTR